MLNKRMSHQQWQKEGCPYCGSKLILLGPRGGLASNFLCAECKARFNNEGPFGIEVIDPPPDELAAELKKLERWSNTPWYNKIYIRLTDRVHSLKEDPYRRKDLLFGLWALTVAILVLVIL